jgi:Domain of unknown function (DUF4153)
MEAVRHSSEDPAWPARPWLWAGLCGLAMFVVNQLFYNEADLVVWRQILGTFIIVLTLAFVVTAEQRRLRWAIAFAVVAATILAFVGWFTASYNKGGGMAEYPFFAGIFALLIAAPLFQTIRDEGSWRFPYARLHSHSWTDAVIVAAALIFSGIAFLLMALIGQLFGLIGIKLFAELMSDTWFVATLFGFAFGAALGMLRERDALVATLQKLVLVVLSVLAPVLAFALIGFLASLPFTGLAALWNSGVPTTPVLLFAAVCALGLINAVISDEKRVGSQNKLLVGSAISLSLTILPLGIIAAISMNTRITEYGFTPDRIWGLAAIIIACVYGVAYMVCVAQAVRARTLLYWDEYIRPANVRIALGLCALALFLALPILDFGAVSARNQMARLKSGITKDAEFDWQAMAYDFGPKGRAALAVLAKNGPISVRELAANALAAQDRWSIGQASKAQNIERYTKNFSYQPASRVLDEAGRRALLADHHCDDPCRIIWLSENRLVVVGRNYPEGPLESTEYRRMTQAEADLLTAENAKKGIAFEMPKVNMWQQNDRSAANQQADMKPMTLQSKVEVRLVERQQIFVDDVPVGDLFAK